VVIFSIMSDLTFKIPEEILEMIFKCLPHRDLKTAVQVCSRWNDVGSFPILWSSLSLVLTKRNLPSLQEMVNSGRLRIVKKLKIKTIIFDEDLELILRMLLPRLDTLEVIIPLTLSQLDVLLSSISEGSNVKNLNLCYNDFSRVDPELLASVITKLDTLDVAYTNLTSVQAVAILTAISEGSKLKYLRMTRHNISSLESDLLIHIMTEVFTNLETFDIMYTRLKRPQTEILLAAASRRKIKVTFFSWSICLQKR